MENRLGITLVGVMSIAAVIVTAVLLIRHFNNSSQPRE